MWSQLPTKRRCRIVSSAAAGISARVDELVQACASPQRIDPVETITGELIPLCGALKFIGSRGAKVLKPRRVGLWGRPLWMVGVGSVVHRVPLGEILILGTWNYPVLLCGVQVAQALAAGNHVQLKPAVGAERASAILVQAFYDAGVPMDQLELLDSSNEAAIKAIADGVDQVVLTGAAETGRKVIRSTADHLSATIMELSGCDAVIVLPGVDLDRLRASIRFGLQFNGSATCIGPRRLLVMPGQRESVIESIRDEVSTMGPVGVHPSARDRVAAEIDAALREGAVDANGRFSAKRLLEEGTMYPLLLDQVDAQSSIASADLFAPVLSVITISDVEDAVRIVNQCPYRLASSIFGSPQQAESLSDRLNVGTVTINDLIAPTGDPRLPFGGRGQSGFGVTRGEEGLLQMTAAKVVSRRRGRFAPHLRPRTDGDRDLLQGLLEMSYGGGFRNRLDGLRRMIRGAKK